MALVHFATFSYATTSRTFLKIFDFLVFHIVLFNFINHKWSPTISNFSYTTGPSKKEVFSCLAARDTFTFTFIGLEMTHLLTHCTYSEGHRSARARGYLRSCGWRGTECSVRWIFFGHLRQSMTPEGHPVGPQTVFRHLFLRLAHLVRPRELPPVRGLRKCLHQSRCVCDFAHQCQDRILFHSWSTRPLFAAKSNKTNKDCHRVESHTFTSTSQREFTLCRFSSRLSRTPLNRPQNQANCWQPFTEKRRKRKEGGSPSFAGQRPVGVRIAKSFAQLQLDFPTAPRSISVAIFSPWWPNFKVRKTMRR